MIKIITSIKAGYEKYANKQMELLVFEHKKQLIAK
jgi:hypothetical protein